jgi:ABC-type Fe3+ transport system substrate-binding protein
MDNDLKERLAHMRAAAATSRQQGEAWLDKLAPQLEQLPKSTVVVINCATGEYATGTTHLDALHQFQQRFGNVAGWMHEIGGGFFVGGGIV